MTEKELENWLINKFESCYVVTHCDYKHMRYLYYDKAHIRRNKLYKLNNMELVIPEKISGYCLFELDTNRKTLWCDYDKIFNFFEKNYDIDRDNIINFTYQIINNKKIKNFKPSSTYNIDYYICGRDYILNDKTKLSIHDRQTIE